MTECESDCRVKLIKAIEDKIPKAMIWKAIVLVLALYGIIIAVYGSGLEDRKVEIKQNTKIATDNKESIAVIKNDLQYLKNGQVAIMQELKKNR